MKLELRLALNCNLCEMEVEPVPECLRPRDPLTGRISLPFCMALGICPVCFTEIVDMSDAKWDKMMRRYKRRMR
jgi:hypothetical protein